MTPIKPLPFGTLASGEPVSLWRLANAHGATADITNLGGCLVSLRVPDAHGTFTDVVLGYDGAAAYAVNVPNFGAPVGRHANRIGGAAFTIDGVRYQLEDNEKGNNLHSGSNPWHRRLWQVEEAEQGEDGARITLSLVSPDGDQGFPGEVRMRVSYELTASDALAITYEGTPSAPTVINLTNHSYFNLNGHASGTALHHTLQVHAAAYTEVCEDLVPTGTILPVEGTPLDLREPRELAPGVQSDFAPIVGAHGYDHNYVLETPEPTEADAGFVGALREVATLTGDASGISLTVSCDTPGMQVYTGNFVGGEQGKGGAHYHDHDAVCLETQFFPDAPNHPEFAQPVFGPEHPYKSRTVFAFSHA